MSKNWLSVSGPGSSGLSFALSLSWPQQMLSGVTRGMGVGVVAGSSECPMTAGNYNRHASRVEEGPIGR